jgi:hypothetical protein
MATLAESFLADLADLEDDAPSEEPAEEDDMEEDKVNIGCCVTACRPQIGIQPACLRSWTTWRRSTTMTCKRWPS